MRFITALCVTLCCLSAAAANLLHNGDFNGKDLYTDFVYKTTYGTLKLTDFTEDMTWNKCLKAQITSFRVLKDDAKLLTADLVFGKKGLAVESDTVYNFSFDFKGDIPLSMFVNCYNEPVDNPKVKPMQILRPNPRAAKPDKNNWSNVKGYFKTPANTKYITFTFRFWANSTSQRNFSAKVGDMVLLDNIKIEKKATLDNAAAAPAAAPVKKVQAYLAADKVKQDLNFIFYPWLKNPAKLPVDLAWEYKNNTMYMTLAIADTQKNRAQSVSSNGKGIWKDQVCEVFFAPADNSGVFYQFACSASGGRYRSVSSAENGAYQQWKASAARKSGKIIYSFEIPAKLFTANGTIANGEQYKFNIGFKYNNVNYTLAPVKTGFSDTANFALMIFGSLKDFQQKTANHLRKDAPAKITAEIDRFAAQSFADAASALQAAELLKNKIRAARMGSAPFVVAVMPLASDYSYPLEIAPENLVNNTIKLQAAGNEIAMLPLVICNRTNATAAYRVVIHHKAKDFFHFEDPTLDNNFPAGNITLREAVPVKDSESKNITQMFDALPRMNEAQTITIPAKSSGMVWVEFDTANVPAGQYNGSIRIIPLAEAAEHTRVKYSGATQDHPITLEVLPFKLNEPANSWLCAYSGTADHLKYMRQLGASRVHITPFAFKFKFDRKGNLIDDNNSTETVVNLFKKDLEYFKQINAMHVKPKFMFAYGIAGVFERVALPKSIKPMTPEWENCWVNYLKAVRDVIYKSGLTMEDVVFELWDEPKGEIHAKLLRMTQLARQTLPDGRFTITWPAQKFQYKAEQMKEFDDLLDEQTFHWLLRNDPAYTGQIKKIQQKKGVITGMYQCSTNLREDLNSYFRLHPWRVFQGGFDMVGFYDFCAVNWGQVGASDWKRVPYGGIVYRSGNNCVPSIRFMLFRRGVDDVRYLQLLQKYQQHSDVAKFLKDMPAKVVNTAHDSKLPDSVRNQAIKLLLKYHK